MPRYFIKLSYNGTNYHGWQIQNNADSVQANINAALSMVLKEKINVLGAGRTDTGVHAKVMYAHFDTATSIDQTEKMAYRLNSILPKDIAIDRIFRVGDEVHARFGAKSRTYEYLLIHKRDPFRINKAYLCNRQLDMEAMNEAAKVLLERTDFTSFSKLHTQTFTNNCDVTYAKWESVENGLKFTIKADRFLRNMVRAIVGTLIEVGLGKMTKADFQRIIDEKNRSKAGFSVPAEGLYLIDIAYNDDIFFINE